MITIHVHNYVQDSGLKLRYDRCKHSLAQIKFISNNEPINSIKRIKLISVSKTLLIILNKLIYWFTQLINNKLDYSCPL